MAGQVIGVAGRSLARGGDWLEGRSPGAGLEGERQTAKILKARASADNGPTVLHDLDIPISGISANIDHIVVSGRTVQIIDSKLWKPGVYWTFAGRTFRGLERFTPAEKKTMTMAQESITRFLADRNIRAKVSRPLLIVWPSNGRAPLNFLLFRSPGARAITGRQFGAGDRLPAKSADPFIVAALSTLVITSRPSPSQRSRAK